MPRFITNTMVEIMQSTKQTCILHSDFLSIGLYDSVYPSHGIPFNTTASGESPKLPSLKREHIMVDYLRIRL